MLDHWFISDVEFLCPLQDVLIYQQYINFWNKNNITPKDHKVEKIRKQETIGKKSEERKQELN